MCKLLNGKSLLFAALLLSAVSMSCSKDPQDTNSKQSGNNVHEWEDSTLSGDAVMGEKMMFHVGDSLQVIRKPSTRLSTDFGGQTYTLSGDERITIAMKRGSEAEVIKIYKVKDAATGALEYEKDADGNKTEPFYWKSTTETVKLRAWSYGTSEAYTSDPLTTPFTLNTIQTELAVGKDNYRELLYDKQRNYPYAANITLNLYHQLARITVELTNSATSDLSIATNGVTIGGGMLPTSAQFVAPTSDSNIGSWDDLSNTGTVIARVDNATEKKYSAVVFPKTYSAGTKIVGVTTTAESPWNSYAYTLPSGGEELEAGKQYSYKVNVRDLVLVSSLTVSDIAAVTYNGSAQTPEPTVTDPVSGKVLTKDTHYTLSYTNNTNAGTATCTVTGKGIYSGTQSKNFTINKKAATISFANATLTKTYEDADFTVTVNNTGDGTVTYASANTTDATVGSGNGTVSIKNANTTGFNITATVVDGTNYTYATKTASYKLTINKKDLTNSAAFRYATNAITKDYIWEIGTMTTNPLTNTKGVTVTYSSNVPGVATVNSNTGALTPGGTLNTNTTITATVTGSANYTGTATYTIKATSKEKTFSYINNTIQSETLCAGTYQLEVWGAQGGQCGVGIHQAIGTNPELDYIKGGYSKGNKTLTSNTPLFICVGGAGGRGTNGNTTPSYGGSGGYNGGGAGGDSTTPTSSMGGGGGGGATHIATSTGTLYTVLNNSSTKGNVLIVAGGGGGCTNHQVGGTGGGSTGGASQYAYTLGIGSNEASQNIPINEATTSSNYYHLGEGQTGYTKSTYNGWGTCGTGGGGGGYYGGKAYQGEGIHTDVGGAGGTGYIGGVTGGTGTTTDNVRSGNGQAKITWVSN